MEIPASTVPRLGSQAESLQTSALASSAVFEMNGAGAIRTAGSQCLILRTAQAGGKR